MFVGLVTRIWLLVPPSIRPSATTWMPFGTESGNFTAVVPSVVPHGRPLAVKSQTGVFSKNVLPF